MSALPGMEGDFAKGASGPGNVYDTSPTGLGLSPAYLSQGATASASSTAGTSLLGHGTRTTSISTTGTTFGTGADLLAAALSFTADGISDYRVSAYARHWDITGSDQCFAHLNLDAADGGIMAEYDAGAGVATAFVASTVLVAPSAGSHTVNVRVRGASGGTVSVAAGSGGALTSLPLLVIVEKLG